MDTLIVSKTHMSSSFCIGGLVLATNKFVRLINSGGYNQPSNTPFEVGDVWDISFSPRNDIHPPHIEDVIIGSKVFKRKVKNISEVLKENNLINWNGHVDTVLDGKLTWTSSGTGYIPFDGDIPTMSVGNWIADKDLTKFEFDNKVIKYKYSNGLKYRSLKLVGCQEPVELIPAGTILRLSLSRVFPNEGSTVQTPKGYYLQLSGWYDISSHQELLDDDDLPF